MTDLIERLRAYSTSSNVCIYGEAATEIERLTKENGNIREICANQRERAIDAEIMGDCLSKRVEELEGLMDAAVEVWTKGIWTGGPADMTRVMAAQSEALNTKDG